MRYRLPRIYASPEQTQAPARVGARRAAALVALGLLACAAAATVAFPAEARRGAWAGPLLRSYALLWGGYLLAALVVTRTRSLPRGTLVWIVGIAALLHVLVYLHPIRMSTDSYRYVWDGRLVAHGVNPYQYPPNAPELTSLRDENYARMEFHWVHTLYPPGAEGLFGLLAALGSTNRVAFFWTFMGFNVGITLLLIPILRLTGRRAEEVIWYAWNPLPIVETAAGGHLDVVGVFFLILALLLIARGRNRVGVGAALAYAASVLCKGPAALTFPCFAWRGRGRFIAVFIVVVGLAFWPFLTAGKHLFEGLLYYFAYWETNASISLVLRHLYDWIRGLGPGDRSGAEIMHSIAVVRAITNSLLVVFMVWQLRRRREDMEWLLSSTFGLLAAYLLLGAPVYPWYVIWTVPLLCWWRVPGWAWFTFTVFSQYYARFLLPRPFHELLLIAGYVPVYGLLIWQWTQWRRGATGAVASAEAGPR